MTQFTVSRNSAILRDAIGSLWMTTAGSIAALGAVFMISSRVLEAIVLLGIVDVVCVVLYSLDISTLRAALRLLRETSPEIVAARKKLSRRFGLVVGIEMLFFPVAALFKMWQYYLPGLLFSLAAIITLIATPYRMHIGRLSSWMYSRRLSAPLLPGSRRPVYSQFRRNDWVKPNRWLCDFVVDFYREKA